MSDNQHTRHHILVLGVSPLPFDETTRLFAPGLRIWQITEVIRKAGHQVSLAVIDFGIGTDTDTVNACVQIQKINESFLIYRLVFDPKAICRFLESLHSKSDFHAVVSNSDIMNSIAAQLAFDLPIWLDYNGDVFAEKQVMGKAYGNDATLLDQWALFFQGLKRGDRFSTCSPWQTSALLGQLGFAGRLNQFTSGERLVCDLLACSRVMQTYEDKPSKIEPLRTTVFPQDAFIILWMGGYNSWTDPETLFCGIELAMQADPQIYYVSTGGPLEGHNTATFKDFHDRIQNSPYKNRFHFTGWLPTEDIPHLAKQANLAVSLDIPSVEATLGYRTRTIDWMLYRIPIATTALSYITERMAHEGCVFKITPKDPQSLCDVILHVKSHPEEAAQKAEFSYQWINRSLTDEGFVPLIRWCNSPVFAGDHFRSSSVCAFHSSNLQTPHCQTSIVQRIRRKCKTLISNLFCLNH